MSLPKGVQTIRKRLADGSTTAYYYWRATGTRLPADPSSPEFLRAIEAAKRPGGDNKPGTFGALLEEYRHSTGYQNLKQGTRNNYECAINRLAGWHAHPVEAIRRRDIMVLRDGLASRAPQAANQLVMVLSILLEFAVEREYREANPCRGINRLPGSHHNRWTEDQVTYALTNVPECYRRAIVLALHTGQREGDCCAMRWSQYNGRTIELTQEKTGAKLQIPVTAQLKAELDVWRRDATAVTVLTNAGGRPWVKRSFAVMFSMMVRRHPPLVGTVFHGLRMTAAARLAEAGCSAHEIAAITGHASLAMVQLYTRGADQVSRAVAAVQKLERAKNAAVNPAVNQPKTAG